MEQMLSKMRYSKMCTRHCAALWFNAGNHPAPMHHHLRCCTGCARQHLHHAYTPPLVQLARQPCQHFREQALAC
jgi:hypothetical protein